MTIEPQVMTTRCNLGDMGNYFPHPANLFWEKRVQVHGYGAYQSQLCHVKTVSGQESLESWLDDVLLLYMPFFFWVCLDIEQWKRGQC